MIYAHTHTEAQLELGMVLAQLLACNQTVWGCQKLILATTRCQLA